MSDFAERWPCRPWLRLSCELHDTSSSPVSSSVMYTCTYTTSVRRRHWDQIMSGYRYRHLPLGPPRKQAHQGRRPSTTEKIKMAASPGAKPLRAASAASVLRKMEQRQLVAAEIVSSEAEYVDRLNVMVRNSLPLIRRHCVDVRRRNISFHSNPCFPKLCTRLFLVTY